MVNWFWMIPFAVWNARPIYIFTLLILFPNYGACTSTAMEEKKKSEYLRVSSASYARLGDWFCIVITTCMRGAYDSPSFWPEWIQYWHVFPARAGLHYFKKCEWMDNCRIPPNSHLLHCETFGDWTCASENVGKQKYATQASTSLPPNSKEVTQRQEWRVVKWDCETCPRALNCWEEFGAQGLKPRL